MSQEFDAIVYGTICLDILWRVDSLPPAGGYVDVLEERRTIGGEAANTAIALARWGVRPALLGNLLGDDTDGRLLLELFAREAPEIDTRFLKVSPSVGTPNCVCMATPDGERTMYGHRFVDMPCAPLDPALAAAVPLFTMEPNAREAGAVACRVAAQAGAFTVPMDYADDPEINAIASMVVTSSERVGSRLPAEELNITACRVRDRYGPTAIVTCGARGCFVAERGRTGEPACHVPAYDAPAVVDSTGAGDVFRAGLMYGRLQGWELMHTVKFASAAAALNCTVPGGWCGVRSIAEIEAFQKAV